MKFDKSKVYTAGNADEVEVGSRGYRPYRNTNEMIEDFKRRYNSYGGRIGNNNPMQCPLIWLKRIHSAEKELITNFDSHYIYMSNTWKVDELLNQFTYLDGSPVGMEE